MKRRWIVLGVFLAACSNQPLYSPARDSESVGYYDTRLTESRIRITFNGYTHTPAETVKNYALLRAAELTVNNGYDWFKVVDREQEPKRGDRNRPKVSVSIGVGTGVRSRCYPYGCRIIGGPAYTGIGVNTQEYADRRQSILEIVMGKGEPDDPTSVYNAKEIITFLQDTVKQE